MLGQHTNTLDFGTVLAGRKILLVNLAKQNVISEDNQHLLGTLLVNELLTAAFARPQKARIPFFCFIDEFQHFVTKDICEILDGGRKFDLHLILAHQHLNQLKRKDPEVYYSTLGNARAKVVFGGLIDEDLDILAKELYTGEFNPDQVKDEIWHTVYRPVEKTRTVRSSSEVYSTSESDSHGDAYQDSSASISHQSLVNGLSFIPGSEGWTSAMTGTGTGLSSARGSSSSRSRSAQTSSASGSSESVVPWYEFHEDTELTSRTFRSLEEQLYIKKAQMKRQPTQHAQILIPDKRVQSMRALTLRDFSPPDRLREEFKQECREAARCFKTPQDAEQELQTLEENLLQPISSQEAEPLESEDGRRWH